MARQRNLITQLVKIIVNEKLAKLPNCEIMLQESKRSVELDGRGNDSSGIGNASAETHSSLKATTVDGSLMKDSSQSAQCSNIANR